MFNTYPNDNRHKTSRADTKNKYYLLSEDFENAEDDITIQPIKKNSKKPKKNKQTVRAKEYETERGDINSQNNILPTTLSYIDRINVKKEIKIEELTKNDENKNGWIVMQGNKKNNKITTYEYPASNKYYVKTRIKNNTFNFRNYYISVYGVDKYNEMFISPYHDYNYFNRSTKNNQIKKQYEETAIKNCKCAFLNNKYRTEHLPYKLYKVNDSFGNFNIKYISEEILSESENETETFNIYSRSEVENCPTSRTNEYESE